VKVLVPQKLLSPAADPYEFLRSVGDYARDVKAYGVNSLKIPNFALASPNFEYYIFQVKNSGHRGFIEDAGNSAFLILEQIEAECLKAPLKELGHIIASVKTWMIENSDKVDRLIAHSGEDHADLSSFDALIHRLDEARLIATIADVVRKNIQLQGVEKRTLGLTNSTIANWIANDEDTQREIACKTFKQVTKLFKSPVVIGLALAAGQDGSMSSILTKPFRVEKNPEKGAKYPVSIFDYHVGKSELFMYSYGEEGLTLSPNTAVALANEVKISKQLILRTQNLMKQFKMQQSIALRWWRVGYNFAPKEFHCYERPNWSSGKFQLRWIGENWAVKGSPEKSTFVWANLEEKESMSLDAIQSKATEFGLIE
jgi:hypothetical protein